MLALSFWRFGIDFLYVIVPIASVAAVSYRMHVKRLAQKTRLISEASRIHLATVEALATAIDARDQVGVGHVRRTQIYAVGLGELMGLSDPEISALRTGALLHDIGKLAVPDHILNKPGDLTPAELEKTKIHPQVGAAILETVGFDYPVVPTVRYHHECWDGSGYPEGLKGENIPLTARVLSVADAFDTLRGARPYRSALERDKARQTIQAEAGLRFDPAIVSVLIRNLNKLEQRIIDEGLAYDDAVTDELDYAQKDNYVEQIKRANREVFSLYELAREFSGSLNLNETLDMFAKKVREFVPFDTCALYLLDETKTSAVASHVEGEFASTLSLRRIKVGQGATGYALKRRAAVQGVDPDLDFSYSEVELCGRYKTIASVPLIADEDLIGAITIYSHGIDEYADEHIRLLETLSRIAADAIGKSLKHNETQTHALTDPMTGLPNARSLQVEFEKEAGRAGRSGTGFQLLMMDLDGFKAVNDSFGHKVGDALLYEVGRVIRGQLREYDFLARYGGDEFVALVPDTAQNDLAELCTRIEEAVAEFRMHVDGENFAAVGVSLGAAAYPAKGGSFDQMIMAADKAMYRRKVQRKAAKAAAEDLSEDEPELDDILETGPEPAADPGLIVELDESHVIASAAVH